MTTRGEKVHEGIPLASGCKRSEMVVDEVFPGTAFLVHGLFSEEECAHYVAESEKLGYRDIGSLYQKTYRTNDRLLLHSEELTQEAYRRLLPHLPRTMLVESGTSRSYWQTPDDAVEEGDDCYERWEATGMNPRWRFCRYGEGGFFRPHRDACYTESADSRSMLTVNIYLNDSYEGGSTNFLAKRYGKAEDREVTFRSLTVYDRVQPKTGSALVFVHWLLHEGQEAMGGQKYLCRSDVMYKRCAPPADPRQAEAEALLAQAEQLEAQGKCDEAVVLYKRAYRICPHLDK